MSWYAVNSQLARRLLQCWSWAVEIARYTGAKCQTMKYDNTISESDFLKFELATYDYTDLDLFCIIVPRPHLQRGSDDILSIFLILAKLLF